MLEIYMLNLRQFQAFDRETDLTLVLFPATNHPGVPMRELAPRSMRQDLSLLHAPALGTMHREFAHIASQRAASRSSRFTPLAERLSTFAGSVSGEWSEAATSERKS
jgi:hypothetical protein